MFKKICFCLFLFILILGCRKKDSLEIDEDRPAENEAVNENILLSESILDNKPLVSVGNEDVLDILVRADGAPGMYQGEDGLVYGFYVDLERMIMKEMNQSYRFSTYTDLGPVIQAMKIGTSHIALATPDVPDYRAIANLSIPFENLNYVTFIRDDDNSISGNTKEEIIKSFYGKRIGVQTQGHIYQLLRDIKEIELVDYPTTTKAMEALNDGFIDAVPENKETGYYYIEVNNWDLKNLDTVLLSYKTTTGFSRLYDTGLIQRYNKALQALMDNGSVHRLRESYYGDAAEEYKP